MSDLSENKSGPDITGIYGLGSTSPEGASHLIVLEDGNYAITYFGGIQIGEWELVEDGVFRFVPKRKESEFGLFGRHNQGLAGRTRILFGGFEGEETFFQFNTEEVEPNRLQRVFDADANCFSPPYVHTFAGIAQSIAFMSVQHDQPDRSVTTIENPEGYNDLVASYVEVSYHESLPFHATFKNGELHFDEGGARSRSPLDQVGEDLEFIREFIERESNRDILYMNPFYLPFSPFGDEEEVDIHENHVFDEEKNAFIDREYYVEGVEHSTSEESYEDMSIIYSYAALKEIRKEPAEGEINEEPLFQAKRV